jgi:hypothetical protein
VALGPDPACFCVFLGGSAVVFHVP